MSEGVAAERRSRLAALVLARGYERRTEPFRLSSGRWSRDYVDGKWAVSDGAALRLACEAVLAAAPEFEAVGCPTMGADALAHGVALLSGRRWFAVRKEPKGHGRQAWVEGARLEAGERVLLVEDVVSTGASLLRAAGRVVDLGSTVVAATALVDRSPAVAARFAERGIPWLPLLRWSDLGIDPLEG